MDTIQGTAVLNSCISLHSDIRGIFVNICSTSAVFLHQGWKLCRCSYAPRQFPTHSCVTDRQDGSEIPSDLATDPSGPALAVRGNDTTLLMSTGTGPTCGACALPQQNEVVVIVECYLKGEQQKYQEGDG